MNLFFLEHLIDWVLILVIPAIELMGIFIVCWSALKAFWNYLHCQLLRSCRQSNFKIDLANGLATALEFKMASEILKTVIVRDQSELIILGAVIVLRAILSFLIHFEIKAHKQECSEPPA